MLLTLAISVNLAEKIQAAVTTGEEPATVITGKKK